MNLTTLKGKSSKFVPINPIRMNTSIQAMLDGNDFSNELECAECVLWYEAARKLGGATSLSDMGFTINSAAANKDSEAKPLTLDELDAYTAGIKSSPAELVHFLRGNEETAKVRFFELAGCHKSKPLTKSNLVNYYKKSDAVGFRPSKLLLDFLGYLSSLVGDVTNSEFIKELRATDKFIMYHTTATSTPALVRRAMDQLPRVITDALFGDIDDSVNLAIDDYASLSSASKIPESALAYAYIWFSVATKDAGLLEWYQGKRALEVLPVFTRTKITYVFRKLIELESDTDSVSKAGSLDELVEMLN